MSSPTSQLTLSPPRSPSPPPTAAELQAYGPLFRLRRPPVSEPPVPCLACAIKDMHCARYRGDTVCQRCARNAEEQCIFQVQDVTRPEVELTEQQLEQLAEEEAQAAQARGPRHEWLVAYQAQHQGEPEMQCMVFCRDRELSGDRARVLALAAGMLEAAAGRVTAWVHGHPVAAGDAPNLVLPTWLEDEEGWRDRPAPGPEYRRRAAFFEGLTAERAAATARARLSCRERRLAREACADQKRLEREEKARAGGAAGDGAAGDDAEQQQQEEEEEQYQDEY